MQFNERRAFLFAHVGHANSDDRVYVVIGQGVQYFFAVALEFHKTRRLQYAQLMRHGALRCANGFRNVGYALLAYTRRSLSSIVDYSNVVALAWSAQPYRLSDDFDAVSRR